MKSICSIETGVDGNFIKDFGTRQYVCPAIFFSLKTGSGLSVFISTWLPTLKLSSALAVSRLEVWPST